MAPRAGRVLITFWLLCVVAAGCSHGPKPRADAIPDGAQVGVASFYGREFEGRRTASGEKYRGEEFTAAHRKLPFGTRLRVTHLASGRTVEVRVNDRGPFRKGRIVDLSHRAAEALGILRMGLAKVSVEVIE
jgi:rare lipoprotein A